MWIVIYTHLRAQAHTPPYLIHRYFARRPWNVFRQLIEVYSTAGDIILDPFCGGGVTIYEGIRLRRKVIGFDLNPLATFIVRNMVKRNSELLELDSAMKLVLEYLELLYSDYDKVELASDPQSTERLATVEWNELAFMVECNYCGSKVLLSNNNRVSNGRYSCSNPLCSGNVTKGGYIEPKNCERLGYEYLFSVATSPLDRKTTHVCFDDKAKKKVLEHTYFLNKELAKNRVIVPKDEIPLNWDRQYEDLLWRKGIKTFQDLFTERNLLINLLLLNFIRNLRVSKNTLELLRLAFSSSLRDTNIMAFTEKGWQGGKPTTWSKHAYWIPSQFCEVNVLSAFRRALKRVRKLLEYNSGFSYEVRGARDFKDLVAGSNLLLANSSLDESDIPDSSIDAIITDPPYGSNVQYLELSHFWYPWNKDMYGNEEPNFSKEAVANRKKFQGAKTMKDYENNLYSVFGRCYQVLKPGKYMVLTFNNKNIGAWLAVLFSILRAGFMLSEGGLFFQGGVENYKQTAHTKYEGSPYGDFIYVFQKNENEPIHVGETGIDENKLIGKLDAIFEKHLSEFEKAGSDRNETLRGMILETIPHLEEFVKSTSSKERHRIYDRYNKDYLKKMYLNAKEKSAEANQR